MTRTPYLYHLLSLFFIFQPSSAVDFVFNGFDSSSISLYGIATVESRILTLTNETIFSIGRAFFKSKIATKSTTHPFSPLPFYTSFIFSIAPSPKKLSGHGFAFLFTPSPSSISNASSAQSLGLFNGTNNGDAGNHILAIEFDVFQNQEFGDIDANHVGVDIDSLSSESSYTAGFWRSNFNDSFVKQTLNNGVNYQAWIDYSGSQLNVSMARAGSHRPNRPLISISPNLSDVFLDQMYVGFSASTGQLVETHRILAWSFSNFNSSAYRALLTSNLPSFVSKNISFLKSKAFIAGISMVSIALLACWVSIYIIWERNRRNREGDETEEWEMEYWPHRIRYRDISAATRGFSEENMIGVGGSGKVYRGVMNPGSVLIAVKCIPDESEQGMKEFLAEVSSLGRLKHRNLVGLIGWCKRERGGLMLVYDYMENGSLDKRIFFSDLDCRQDLMLDWDSRVRVLKDVGHGVLYLHEGWEARVLHGDIKASNVMLDKDMIGRLGDFGLARMHPHGQALGTTRVVGTVGYMAPEVVRAGKTTEKTDMFGYGVLVLEVVSGRRPVEEGKEGLLEWVRGLMERRELGLALDPRLREKGEYKEEEVERLLHLGLICSHPDPSSRPTMRQVLKVLEGGGSHHHHFAVDESSEAESMDACLIAAGLDYPWFRKYQKWSNKSHPTFEDIRKSLSSSISLSNSDVILEGR